MSSGDVIFSKNSILGDLNTTLSSMQAKKQQLELDMEHQTGSQLGKKSVKAVYRHPTYLTYMQSISCEIMGWMKHKVESRLPGEISVTSDSR